MLSVIKCLFTSLPIALLVFQFSWASAQVNKPVTIFDTIYHSDLDLVELHLNIDTMLANKFNNEKQDGQLSIISGDRTINLPVGISVRSKSRRRYCDFPPLKLDFVKSDLEAVGLDNEDEYKVVTHCLDQKIGEELLLKEYLIYELYRIITPMSLRAKLLDLVYVDDTREERISKKAILLESEKEFAKNNGGKLCNCMGTSPDSLDGRNMEIVAMFQYMIGNSDMDYKVERNVTLIKPEDGGPWHSVAYDFDFSSFVNAPYVHPKVVDNRQIKRVYLGFRQNASLLPEVINLFLSKEDQIYACIDNFDMISNKERRNCLKYIKEFYSEIKQEDFAFPYQVNLNGH